MNSDFKVFPRDFAENLFEHSGNAAILKRLDLDHNFAIKRDRTIIILIYHYPDI